MGPGEADMHIHEQPDVAPPDPTKRRRVTRIHSYRVALLIILVLAFLLRIWNLSYNTAFLDEARHVVHGARLLAGESVLDLMGKAGYPYVYPVLAALADAKGGLSAVRFVNAILGTITVLAIFLLTQTLYSSRAAIYSALLFSFFAPTVFISRFSTQDALSNALFAFTLFILAKGVKQGKRLLLSLAAVVGFLAFLAKYPAGFHFPFIFLALYFHEQRKTIWVYFALPLTILASLYVGYYFWGLVSQFLIEVAIKHAKYENPCLKIVQQSLSFLGPAMLLALLGLVKHPRERLKTLALVGGSLVLLLYHFVNQDSEALYKHVAYGLIFLAPAAGLGLDSIPGRDSERRTERVRWAFTVIIVMVFLFLLCRQQVRVFQTFWPNTARTVDYLEEHLDGEETILAENGSIYIYYLQLHGPRLSRLTIYNTFRGLAYGNKRDEEAILEAVKDRCFDYIILDGTSTPSLDEKIVAALKPGYSIVFQDTCSTSKGEITIAIYKKNAQTAGSVGGRPSADRCSSLAVGPSRIPDQPTALSG